MFKNAWRRWLRRLQSHAKTRPICCRKLHRLDLEILESRLAPATWSGDIFDTTPGTPLWTNTQVQEVTGAVHVPAGKTLTIQAGTVVKFDNGGTLTVDGTFVAQGTAAQTIIFTSINDNSPEGGSNTASAGNWSEIVFNADSTANIVDNAVVRYGGSNGNPAEVYDKGAPLTLSNTVVSNSGASGVRLEQSTATLNADTFTSNNGAAVSMDLDSNPTITGETDANFTGNNTNGLTVDAGSLAESLSWSNPDIVYVLGNNVTVPAGLTLTVGAGQVVKLSGNSLTVDGTLNAQGAAAAPVVFTSLTDDTFGGDTNNNGTSNSPHQGLWGDIQLNADSTNNVVDQVEILYAGSNGNPAALYDDGAPLTLSNSVVSNSGSAGVRLEKTNATLQAGTFTSNNGAAVSMDLDSNPTITGETVSSFAGNMTNGLAVDGGTLVKSLTWSNPDIVYAPANSVTVPTGLTLTVGAGQVVKLRNSVTVDGTLKAQGTAATPIIFTSINDDTFGGDTNNNGSNSSPHAGDWGDLQFNADSTNNVLDQVEVLYAGSNGTQAAINDQGGPLTLSSSVINNSGSAAIVADAASMPTITNATAQGDAIDGLEIAGGTLTADTAWTNNTGLVYVPNQTITIPQGITLTLDAGVIVKPAFSFPNLFLVNGTLKAQGTTAAPVVVTSINDDSVAGDTNNNGPSTGSPGNWGAIVFTATSTNSVLNHTIIRFGTQPDGDNLGEIDLEGASATISNSVISNSGHVGIFVAANSTAILTSDLIVNNVSGLQAEATANVTAFNNTIDGSHVFGVILDSPTIILTNNLITNSGLAGITETGPTNLTMSFNDVFNPSASQGNYASLTNMTGQDGNISADPLYFNEASGQYELHPGSPAEDAGTGTGAPTTDFLGNPRFQDPNITGRGDNSGTDIGAIWVEQNATSTVDLATAAVTGPTAGLEGQSVAVNWTVQSVGTSGATGSWHDAVYLSASPVLTPDAILLGQVQRTGDLGPGQSYNASGTFTLPGVTPGNYYFLVRANSQNEVFEGSALANNIAASTTVAMGLPTLTIGTPLNGSLAATGSGELYQVTTVAGGNLNVSLTGAGGDTNELYVAFGDVPTRQAFDARGIQLNSANQTVSLANVQAGTYYVLVYGANVPSAENFTLTAGTPSFSITSVSPAQGGNTGPVTLSISGAQFDGNSQPQLVDSAGVTIKPLSVYFTDPGSISATFDLTGLPTGPANVQVVNSGVTTSLPGGFGIIAGQAGQLVTNVSVPSAVRLGREFPVTINYRNDGSTDLLAPIMSITASTGVELSFSSDLSNPQGSLALVGVDRTGPAGVLAPGAQGQITVYATSTAAGAPNFQLAIGEYPALPIDWADISPLVQPATVSNAVWGPIFAKVQQDVGATWDLYAKTVAADATLLPSALGLNYSLGDVLQLEIPKAEAQLQPAVSGQVYLNDTSHPLANVTVQLFDASSNQAASAITLTDGSFLLPDVTPGTYAVSLDGAVLINPVTLTVGSGGLAQVQLLATAAGTISGSVVLGQGGVPVRGEVVSATSSAGSFTATTDANGRYEIDSLPAGTYEVDVAAGETAAAAGTTAATVAGVVVAGGALVPNIELVLQPGGTITGGVSGPSGPLAGAVVTAIGAVGTDVTATTASDGTFTLSGLPSDTYILQASASGLAQAELDGIVVASGATIAGQNLILGAAGSISGVLKELSDGTPVASVLVDVEGSAGSFSAQSDANGAFLVSNLPAGSYTITTVSDDFMTTTDTATVGAGANTPLTLTLSPSGQVQGTVLDAHGAAVANVVVYAADANGIVASTTTDANGAYALTGLDADTYEIVLGDTSSPGVARTQVTLTPQAGSAQANFSVAVAGIISGTVFASDGSTPLANVNVTLSQDGAAVLSVLSDANGNYSFVVLAAATYQVNAGGNGFAFAPVAPIALSGGNVVANVNFSAGNHVISGVVHMSNSSPSAGATVEIELQDAAGTFDEVTSLTTASDGSFQFAGATPGSYQIIAEATGFASTSGSVSVSSGNPPGITLTLGTESSLHGVVGDSVSGAVVAGAEVILTTLLNPTVVATAVSDASGAYTLSELTAGSYRFIVEAAGHQTLVNDDLVVGTGAQPLNAVLDPSSTHVLGIVQDSAGPLSGALVRAMSSNGDVVASVVAGADGSYALDALGPGTYTLVGYAAGHGPSAQTSVSLNPGGTVNGFNLSLTAVAISDPSPSDVIASKVTDLTTYLQPIPPQSDALDAGTVPNAPGVAETVFDDITAAKNAYENWQTVHERDYPLINAFPGQQQQVTNAYAVIIGRATALVNTIANEISSGTAAANAPADLDGLRKALAAFIASKNDYFSNLVINADTAGDLGDGVPFPETNLLGALVHNLSLGREDAQIYNVDLATNILNQGQAQIGETIRQLLFETRFKGEYVELVDKIQQERAQREAAAGDQIPPGQGLNTGTVAGLSGIIIVGAPVVKPPPQGGSSGTFNPVKGPPAAAPGDDDGGDDSGVVEDAFDPNNMTGPAGFSSQGFIQPGTFSYRVDFENDPAHATAAAQVVTTTLTLDPNLDASTFQFTGFGFGKFNFTVPAGLYHYSTTIDLRPDGIDLLVPVTLDENPATGAVTVEFQSLDPATMLPPAGINDGFLPVDDAAGDGEGFFTYAVQPKSGLPTGTAISAHASIVFDTNAPLATPTALNTLDVGTPTSTVAALPATSSTSFTVSWSGHDDTGGSGIAHYDIFVSDNGGPYTLWLTTSAAASATYTGQHGHTYRFYSVATDNVGNHEATPTTAEATTSISATVATTIRLTSDHPSGAVHGQVVKITATVAAADTTAGIPTGTVQFFVDGVKSGSAVTVSGGLAKISLTLAAGSHKITATYTSNATVFVGSKTATSLAQTIKPAPLTITAAHSVKAHVLTVSLKNQIVIHDTDTIAPLTVHLTSSLGKFHIKAAGVTIKGNGTGALILTGHPAAMKTALNALTLTLRKLHLRGTIALSVSDGSVTRRATILVS